MKIVKAVTCTAAFAAVLVIGCHFFYNDSDSFEDNNAGLLSNNVIAAGYDEAAETTTGSCLETVPIAALETEKLPSISTVSFTFLGDCILSSNAGDIRENTFMDYAEEKLPSYFFEKAVPYYNDSDFVIANNEYVLSDRELAKSSKDGVAYWFKSPSSFTSILKAGRIDIVSLANNHTNDYGKEGYADTKASLEDADILWGDIENPVYVKKNGITFGIICTKMFNADYKPIISPVIDEVKENSDIQILMFHGGTEKQHEPDEWLQDMCHDFVDMGVDLIVGSHPHVLRPMEEYKGVDIIYSLGNFCYGANRLPENRTVIFTETFSFDEDGNYLGQDENFIPFYVHSGSTNNWQPAPITNTSEISKTLAFMYGGSSLPY